MADAFGTGALFAHSYQLDGGERVRLRLARASDLRAISELLQRNDSPSRELSAARLVRFDPRREWVLCATCLLDGRERLLGVGAITLGEDAGEPDLLVTADHAGEEIAGLLARALTGAAEVIDRSRAA